MLRRFLVCLIKNYWIISEGLRCIHRDYFGSDIRPMTCAECGRMTRSAHLTINYKLLCNKCYTEEQNV